MNAPLIIVPSVDQVLAVARSLDEVADGLRIMQNLIGLSNKWCEDTAELAEGHTNKLLGPTRHKNLGNFTMRQFCSILAVEWRMHVDLTQAAKMQEFWEGRQLQYVQPLSRAPSKEILDRAKPHVLKDHLKKANTARNAMLSCEQRTAIARNAANVRHRKARKLKRQSRATAGALRG